MKRSSPTEPLAGTAREILAYLAAHPNAQDTIEGIMQWWLLEQDIKRSRAHVQAALVELLARRLVIEKPGTDGRLNYRVNRRETVRIRRMLTNPKT